MSTIDKPLHARRAWVSNRTVFAELESGRVVGVPARLIASIAGMSDAELACVSIMSHPNGDALPWRWGEFSATGISLWDFVEGAPRAVRAWTEGRTVLFELTDGRVFGFPAAASERLARATDTEFAAVKVSANGYGLRWEGVDEEISVPGMVSRRLDLL